MPEPREIDVKIESPAEPSATTSILESYAQTLSDLQQDSFSSTGQYYGNANSASANDPPESHTNGFIDDDPEMTFFIAQQAELLNQASQLNGGRSGFTDPNNYMVKNIQERIKTINNEKAELNEKLAEMQKERKEEKDEIVQLMKNIGNKFQKIERLYKKQDEIEEKTLILKTEVDSIVNEIPELIKVVNDLTIQLEEDLNSIPKKTDDKNIKTN